MIGQNSNTYEETFYIIPRYIRKLPDITLAYLDIYETIFQFWNKNKACFLGEESLCERTGYQRRIIYKALAFFEAHNELERIRKNGKRYLVRPMKIIETDCEFNDEKVIHIDSTEIVPTCTTMHPNVHNRALSTCTTVHHNIKNLNKEILNKEVCDKSPPTQKFDIRKNNPFAFSEETLKGYVEMRKAIKKPLTEQAWKLILNEIQKAEDMGFEAQACIDEAIINSWQGFKAEWIKNRYADKTQNKAPRSNYPTTAAQEEHYRKEKQLRGQEEALAFRKLKEVAHTKTSLENIARMKESLK